MRIELRGRTVAEGWAMEVVKLRRAGGKLRRRRGRARVAPTYMYMVELEVARQTG